MGGHAGQGQPPGVLLLLREWEAPTRRPKANKPELYNTQCAVSLIETGLIVSVPQGVGQMEPSPNSAVFKRKSVTVRLFHDYFKSEPPGVGGTARLSGCSKIPVVSGCFPSCDGRTPNAWLMGQAGKGKE